MIDQNKESTSKNSNWRYLSKYLKAEDYVLLSEAEKILDISEHNKASYIKGRIFFFFLKKELKLYVLNLTSNKIDYSMSMDDFNGWHNIEELENKLFQLTISRLQNRCVRKYSLSATAHFSQRHQ